VEERGDIGIGKADRLVVPLDGVALVVVIAAGLREARFLAALIRTCTRLRYQRDDDEAIGSMNGSIIMPGHISLMFVNNKLALTFTVDGIFSYTVNCTPICQLSLKLDVIRKPSTIAPRLFRLSPRRMTAAAEST
jgi:hypothetical protein